MRQLTFVRPMSVEWRESPDPVITGPLEAILRPLAVARCDLDAAIITGRAPAATPFGMGHECAGRVLAVGSDVRQFKPGDLVALPFEISCGTCTACQAGHSATCTGVGPGSMYGLGNIGGEGWGGAFAEAVKVPFADHMLVRIPPGVSPAQAACVGDNLADAWRAVGPPLREEPGGMVLVLGGAASSIGIWAAELAVRLGAGQVTYLDSDPERLALAEAAGAEPMQGPAPRRLGPYAITVDASGQPEGLAAAIRSTAANHSCTSVSVYWADPSIPFMYMYSRNVGLRTGRVDSREAMPTVLDLIAARVIDPLRIARLVDWESPGEWAASTSPKVVATREV
jgi:threonine dehydrogenase-like Zn-dependent dehydrogenase